MTYISTTPVGTEGFGISYSDEVRLAEALKKILPDWKILFSWSQILFSDVQYKLDAKNKIVEIDYNQNLRHWTPSIVKEIGEKVKK